MNKVIPIKWVCIKKYKIGNDDFGEKTFQVGDIAIIINSTTKNGSNHIYIGPYDTGNSIPMWEGYDNIFEHFVTISQWREQQINSIIND